MLLYQSILILKDVSMMKKSNISINDWTTLLVDYFTSELPSVAEGLSQYSENNMVGLTMDT
jgi:hypothetical protein